MTSPTDPAAALAAVAGALPGGGEDRPGQREMARAVARAIDERRHLVVQAGTGTGKSLAYLLPAVQSGRRVVVATATKALQDQLASKDLPFLAAHVGQKPPFSFAVVKGRSNYLCRQRVAEASGGAPAPAGPGTAVAPGGGGAAADVATVTEVSLFASDTAGDVVDGRGAVDSVGAVDLAVRAGAAGAGAGDPVGGTVDDGRFGAQVRTLIAWAATTASGDRAELDFEPHPRVWGALSVSARECPGAYRCPSGTTCFAEWARVRAASADVVVVNTHLYAMHVASDRAVLPEHEVLILDEAHAVEDIMTAGLGIEVTAGRLRAVAQAARAVVAAEDAGAADAVTDVAADLEGVLRALAGRRVLLAGPSAPTGAAPTPGAGPGPAPALDAGATGLAHLLELTGGRLAALSGALRRADTAAADAGEPGGDADTGARRTRAQLAVGHLMDDLAALRAPDDDHVAWVEDAGPGGRAPTLRWAPVEIGPVLADALWPHVTAVITSATVPPLVEARLGLPRDGTDRIDVGSPFFFREAALLYCASHLPDRRSPDATAAVHGELAGLIEAAGGRTLALFTSWRAMHAAVDALRPVLPYRVLAQNDLPKPRLLEAFTAEESSCLFATMSFWQGVDVPGPTLSLVVVDRLPFPRPDDPLLQARRERAGDAAFRVVDLPRAATLLAQGAGRLIRSSTDTGVVAVLDRRLATAGYRRTLLEALPPMRFTTKRSEALAFLRSIADDRSPAPRVGGQ